MKFNALVVAAMVITSVNASGREGLEGFLKKGCVARSDSKEMLAIENDSESELTQDPPVHGPEPVSSQDSLENGSEPGPSQDSPNNESGKSRESGVTEYDPKCDPIIIKLDKLWLKAYDLEPVLRSQMPAYYKLMKGRT
ncbi:hypothetical protein BASA50_003308 [Batrachochytrium salamandrivorans]|uniref:Uncharacterized protein n=1 Tax=Batrachochytrium salamandrivorans TaxID=1357716 RepID=A0ABQ8FIT5_9FUNG|nr:hypothetical protein BASA60_000360 [Batrachochytrium salamandrivorans]KAH6598988.1 hypothetical protein BASA50_003308 [Batrachochytrium salamandrivorans]KAH9251880.1 hypothetical protein BASA81_010200 [Batrachochytrium salamandrivorans]